MIVKPLPVPARNKRPRTAFTSVQISTLEKTFTACAYMPKLKRSEFAKQLGTSEQVVKVWFQNRRMKQRREQSGIQCNHKSSKNSVSDHQSETSSIISNASAYSDSNKNIEKILDDIFAPNAYPNNTDVEARNVQHHVDNSYDNQIVGSTVLPNYRDVGVQTVQHHAGNSYRNKIVGSTVHHYGGNFNGNFNGNFGYNSNSNHDSFFDPYMGYNFGSNFSTIDTPNYYYNKQPEPPMPNAPYGNQMNPMNIDCNQFVGPM